MGSTRSAGEAAGEARPDRRAVGSEIHPGYRAAIVVIRGDGLGRRHSLDDELVIGYDADRDIVIGEPDALVYARLRACADGVIIEREPSSEVLIKVNDVVVEQIHCPLSPGDVVQVGFPLLKVLQGKDQYAVDSAFHDEIFRLSTIDPVTQVYNRRYFTETFEREVSRVRRYERALSLLMIEVDGLMTLASDRGSTAADELMHGVADVVGTRARASDVVGRYEREVLAVLLPEVGLDGATIAASGLREQIERVSFAVDGGARSCTVSVGVAELDPSHDTLDALLRVASNRLWVAKDSGGNRVVSQGG